MWLHSFSPLLRFLKSEFTGPPPPQKKGGCGGGASLLHLVCIVKSYDRLYYMNKSFGFCLK